MRILTVRGLSAVTIAAIAATVAASPAWSGAAPLAPGVCIASVTDESPGIAGVTAKATCCVVASDYALTATSVEVPFKGVPVFKNGPGGAMAVTKGYSGTASYSVKAGAETEVGAVLAKAKVSISAELSKSNTTSVTNSYTAKITKGKYGNAKYVSYGKRVKYTKFRINRDCTRTTLASGSVDFPSTSEGWKYWETSN